MCLTENTARRPREVSCMRNGIAVGVYGIRNYTLGMPVEFVIKKAGRHTVIYFVDAAIYKEFLSRKNGGCYSTNRNDRTIAAFAGIQFG